MRLSRPRRGTALRVSLAAMLLLAACGDRAAERPRAAAPAAPAAPEFSDSGVPFRFQVPAGWRVQRGYAAGSIAALVVAVPDAGASSKAAVQITASQPFTTGPGPDVEAAMNGVAERVKAQGATTYTRSGRRDVSVAGHPGREEAAEFSGDGGQTLASLTAVFSDGYRIYSISLVAPPAGIAAHQAAYDLILRSFRLEQM
jgi:hypothetical protein